MRFEGQNLVDQPVFGSSAIHCCDQATVPKHSLSNNAENQPGVWLGYVRLA